LTADGTFNLFVDGDFIGIGTPRTRGRYAKRYCIDLLPSFNVFAVNATGSGSTGFGLLATILVTYSDGTTDKLVTDGSWRAHNGSPAGFEQPSFDDTAWPSATIAAADVLVNIPSDPPVVGLERAQWIWTDVVPASGTLPTGSRAFRRTFPLATGQTAMSATILIAADDEYKLYVNGVSIGSGTSFKTAQHYTVDFATPTTEIVIGVLATNAAASTAALIFSMEVNMLPSGRTNCTAGAFLLSDVAWKLTKGAIPAGFQQPGFDDSAWPAVVAEAMYPNGVCGTITIAAPSPAITI
ncbi:hypothetical protein FB451DRAFT_1476448, partial [Mycena latifolia]